MDAQIEIKSNYGPSVTISVVWDGTEAGKVTARKEAWKIAKEKGFKGDFVSRERFS